MRNGGRVVWEVEYTDEFGAWWGEIDDDAHEDIDMVVQLLEARGPNLGFPHSSDVRGSRHTHMRELRVQSGGEPLRILYAFDPRRCAILLIGGNKRGDDRWYDTFLPIADRLYDVHLTELSAEAPPGPGPEPEQPGTPRKKRRR